MTGPRDTGRLLTHRQRRFVAEYLIDANATQAAIRAGFAKKTANREGARLLSNVGILAAVREGEDRLVDKAELKAERVLEEQRRIGFSDIGRAFDAHGRLLPLKDMPDDIRSAIASVKVTKKNLTAGDGIMEDVVEIRLWDKVRALEQLAKHFRLFEPETPPPDPTQRPPIVIVLQAPPPGQEWRALPIHMQRQAQPPNGSTAHSRDLTQTPSAPVRQTPAAEGR